MRKGTDEDELSFFSTWQLNVMGYKRERNADEKNVEPYLEGRKGQFEEYQRLDELPCAAP